MKILNCIISHNRFYYLKNLINSLDEFFKIGDTIIVDDNSDDTLVLNYLRNLQKKDFIIIKNSTKKSKSLHGGLYLSMDLGFEFAKENRYDFINFLQDDLQCMWYDKNLEEKIEKMFSSSENILSITSIFFKKITSYKYKKRLVYYDKIMAYHKPPFSIPDISIIDVKRFDNLKINFSDFANEYNLNRYIYSKGFINLFLKDPQFAFLPWPKSVKFGKIYGNEFKPIKSYFYKPVTNENIKKLKSRCLNELPYTEDYCHTWGYFSLKPYWFTKKSLSKYFKLIKANYKNGIILIPYPSLRF